MKDLLETIPRIELALIIIGVFALMLGILFGYEDELCKNEMACSFLYGASVS